jgi:DNA-binding transcriptional MerR regulator
MTSLLTPKATAVLLGVSTSTLRYWRTIGKGPPVIRLESGTFRYQESALLEYIEDRRVSYPCGKQEEEHVSLQEVR